jgi:colanic acid biosynthesis glycosyl transferase WcaI
MRIQLWSYNYAPEPSGIGPLSAVWAQAMNARGHSVEVVAAHPHYPEPVWGRRLRPYREWRDGIRVLRLPLWPGRGSAKERMRQEASFAAALTLAVPALRSPDVIIAVSPSFPALVPAMANARARRIPWILWLQDVLPDAAIVTGILEEGAAIQLARRLEHAAYRSATRIVVISESFQENQSAKGVDPAKVVRSYNPASLPILDAPRDDAGVDGASVLTMGNIGYSQNLLAVTRAFEDSAELRDLDARFVMAGDGQAAAEVRAAIRTDRVRVTGMLDNEALERELRRTTLALVSQDYDGVDFNVPSKLMNFMGYGIPTVGAVRADSEVARIIRRSGGGWVTPGRDPAETAAQIAAALGDPAARAQRGRAALEYARSNFTPDQSAQRFETMLRDVVP